MLVSNLCRSNINYLRLRGISTVKTTSINILDLDSTVTTAKPLKSWNEIPGPWSLPIVGPLHHFLPGGSMHKLDGMKLFDHLYKTYGPIVKIKGYLSNPDMVFSFDAESSAQVYQNEKELPKRPTFLTLEYYRKVYKKQKGYSEKFTGLVTDQGEEWKELRAAANPILMQPTSMKLYNKHFDEITQEMIMRMKYFRNENNIIEKDLFHEISLWALECTGVIGLDTRLNCINPHLPMDPAVQQLLENVHTFFDIINKFEIKPSIWQYYHTEAFKQAMEFYEKAENLHLKFVNDAVEKFKTKSKPDNEKSVLEKLVEIDKNIANKIVNDFFSVGIDTVICTMISMLYLLAINPEKQNKLREEIKAKTPRRPYTKACIKEAMRLMPIGFGSLRQTTKEYNLLNYEIPKNTCVLFIHQYMGNMECHYPRPLEYIPERWTVDKDHPLYHGNAHPLAFAAFGYGPRGCVGQRVANMELETLLTQVIENFRIEWFGEPLKMPQVFFNHAAGPYNFIFKDAEDN